MRENTVVVNVRGSNYGSLICNIVITYEEVVALPLNIL